MSSVAQRRGTTVAVQVLSTIVLAAGLATAPQTLTSGHAAFAADATCTTFSVPTYVFEPAGSSTVAGKRVLHKYMEWGPKSADTDLLDTQYTATLPATSKVFTGGGNGILYEATTGGQVKTYKDGTATGGSLLTPVKTYSLNWSSAKWILTNGTRILVIGSDGTTDVYSQSNPATGDGTITKIMDNLKTSVTTSLAAADDAWMVNSAVQWLTDGKVQQSTISNLPPGIGSTPPGIRLETPTTVATGIDAAQAWAPGPNALSTQSVTSDPDTTGQVRSYTTGPLTTADDDVRSGIVGEVMADAGPCLADPDPNVAPYFGSPADDSGVEAASDSSDDPAPAPSRVVTGKFTLGNGQPAPGLPVTILASDVGQDATGQVNEAALGTTTTASDGTWSLTLPETLPAEVQKARDDNGGVLNIQAVASGSTSAGVSMLGLDALTAVTGSASQGAVAAAADDDHTVKLVPDTVTESTPDSFAAATDAQTYAARVEADPQLVDADTPLWQSDHSTLAADYNPYLVDGKDVSDDVVKPEIDHLTCDWWKFHVSDSTKYTVVGEAHAGWDTKATFEYSDSMSSSFEIAYKAGSHWTISGSKELSGSTGVSVGFYSKGPHYAHQYKVPIKYTKWKHQYICNGIVRETHYTIEAARYNVPSGGAVGKVGKDVSSKDGTSNYNRSPKSYRSYIEPGNGAGLTHGSSVKFGGAVSVFGVSLGDKTGYDSNHTQRIVALNKSGKHYIWGKNGRYGSHHEGVLYSK